MREISSSIDIAAPPEEVWDVLADFAGYSTWNPFIREGRGDAAVGSKLVLKMHPEKGRPLTFRPTVLAAERGRTLKWLGRFVLPGLFDGAHGFTLAAVPQGTRVVQSETFRGLLVPLLGSTIDDTVRNFARLNGALKDKIEQNSATAVRSRTARVKSWGDEGERAAVGLRPVTAVAEDLVEDEWAYVKAYEPRPSDARHTPVWFHTYNHHRGHTTLKGQPPASRVPNLTRQHS